MNHNFKVGQTALFGPIKVEIQELREFWGTPSYMVRWTNRKGETERAVAKETELS